MYTITIYLLKLMMDMLIISNGYKWDTLIPVEHSPLSLFPDLWQPPFSSLLL